MTDFLLFLCREIPDHIYNSFYDLEIIFLNCSDSVTFLAFHFMIVK